LSWSCSETCANMQGVIPTIKAITKTAISIFRRIATFLL
jgi:hypothetical protein